ncbi:membrane protein [Streptomyces phage Faust]|uniref:Membrane protein n=1 Tax=Streptomyces phage Faust TaxID=2767565 RepID=A0A7G9UZ40_9CAUD|nr:membrane protein [Streptomyces phage Faust]QNN99295.1 membrane protein [Streptomyces phage Faust]
MLALLVKAVVYGLAGGVGAVLGFYLTYQMIIHGWLD